MAILMKAGDTAPLVQAILLDADSNPVDIAGATVKFIMSLDTTPRGDPVVEADATNAQTGDGSDGSKGAVTYAWATGDTDTAGSYVCEFEVAYSDGTYQTFPTQDYITATVIADLGGTVG